MKFTELKNDISDGAKSIYLLEGDDAYFRMKGEEMIKSAFLQMPELNFSSFDGESLKGAQISALTSALESFPFMSEKRIIKVSGFYPTETEYETHLKKNIRKFSRFVNFDYRQRRNEKRRGYKAQARRNLRGL